MKIAIFYSGYLPGEKYGGPVTSLHNFTELLGDEHDLYIICSNHDLNDKTPYKNITEGWNKVGKANVLYLSDSEFSEAQFGKIVDELDADFMYVSSIFSVNIVVPVLSVSKNKGIRLLLAPRGELNNTAFSRKLKAPKKIAYLTMLKLGGKFVNTYFQATSEEEKKNILHRIGVDKDKVFFLPNIPTVPVKKNLIKKDSGKLRLCFVGRIVENKNLLLAINALILSKYNIILDIYGPKESLEYWKLCEERISKLPKNILIRYKGAVSPLKMKELYGKYDALISPTQFENYGQAIVEAMLHDTPVIISKGTTPWDDIKELNAGFTIPLDNTEQFTEAIDYLGAMDSLEYKKLIKNLRCYCAKKFNHNELKERYNQVFMQILK